MQTSITFNKSGYDPFIDYIKAFAIIGVLIGHTFPFLDYWGYGLWIGMQVPLFVLVQSFHCFKKETSSFSIKKLSRRVILPFLLIQILLFSIFIIKDYIKNGDYNLVSLLKLFAIDGGAGPGSYYPWVYLQIAILLPIIKKYMEKGTRIQLAVVSLIICEALEIVCSVIDLPDFIYRLLSIRYFFLFYIAWIWVTEGISINRKTLLLSLLSLLAAIYFYYYSVNDEPLFYNTAWITHRWPCYYYVAIVGVYLLYCIYQTLSKNNHIDSFIRLLAKCSYEIFLIQMAIIVILPSADSIMSFLDGRGISISGIMLNGMRIAMIFIISIWGGYWLNVEYGKFVKKVKK